MRSFLVCCAAGAIVMAGMSGMTPLQARQQDRPVIALTCPADLPAADRLCQAMIQALAETSPGHIIRRLDRGEPAPRRPGDMRVTLRLGTVSDHGLSGALEWQPGDAETPQAGPEVHMDVMDATLSPSMYASFAESLIKASTGLVAALGRDESP